jgi:hypothetical protein
VNIDNFYSPEMSILGAVSPLMAAWCLSCSLLSLAHYFGAAAARIGAEGNVLLVWLRTTHVFAKLMFDNGAVSLVSAFT